MGAAVYGASASPAPEALVLVAAFVPLLLAVLAMRGMYGRTFHANALDTLRRLASITSLTAMLLIALAALAGFDQSAVLLLAREWLFATAFVGGGRLVLEAAQRRARQNRVTGAPTLIVGAGKIASHVERRLEHHPEYGLRPVGYLDDDPPPRSVVPFRHAPVLGSLSDLRGVAEATGACHVILTFLTRPDHALIPIVRQCEELGIEISVVPRLFDSINLRVGLEHLGGLPLHGLRPLDTKGWQFAVKHTLDRIAAAVLIVLAAPLLLVIALVVKLSSPGPVLFRQGRIGRDGRSFEILKFRTMSTEGDTGGLDPALIAQLDRGPGGVEGVDRRTRVGTFLRRTSLDELPQLFNVLKGDMSIVGPRPERPMFAEAFGQSIRRYDDRHRVKSGVTGWAQVNGLRGQTSLGDRVEWDNYYIENWSLWLDLQILVKTVGVLFRASE
jgi:exopolysaccharide biosynthesis polyprenyl glycosylphosphotransferase